MSHLNKKVDVFLISMSLIAVLLTVFGLAAFPEQAGQAANQLFELSTRSFGTAVQVLIFAIAVIAALGTIAPGVVLLQCGASFVAAGVALVVFVMRVLLQQAVETATRADALQSELDGVI